VWVRVPPPAVLSTSDEFQFPHIPHKFGLWSGKHICLNRMWPDVLIREPRPRPIEESSFVFTRAAMAGKRPSSSMEANVGSARIVPVPGYLDVRRERLLVNFAVRPDAAFDPVRAPGKGSFVVGFVFIAVVHAGFFLGWPEELFPSACIQDRELLPPSRPVSPSRISMRYFLWSTRISSRPSRPGKLSRGVHSSRRLK
jgi:hypothetical protein